MTTTTIENTPIAFTDTQLEAKRSQTLREGVSRTEIFPDGSVRLVSHRSIPNLWALIKRYQKAAMGLASVKSLEDGTYYASVPQLRGTWSNEANPWSALNTLDEVVLDWIVVKISCGDRDFPILEGIDLNDF